MLSAVGELTRFCKAAGLRVRTVVTLLQATGTAPDKESGPRGLSDLSRVDQLHRCGIDWMQFDWPTTQEEDYFDAGEHEGIAVVSLWPHVVDMQRRAAASTL